MGNQAKVESVYNSVKAVDEPEAFRYIIEKEADESTLSGLSKRFWDGHGEKPWQVVEIEREMARRGKERGIPHEGEEARGVVQVARITARQAMFVSIITVLGGVAGAWIQKASTKESGAETVTLRDSVRQLGRTVATLQRQLGAPSPWLFVTGIAFSKPGAQVRLFALADGIAYTFPTALPWGDGDGFVMDSLPLANKGAPQTVRFSARYALPGTGLLDAGSSEVVSVPAVPYTGEYRLYQGSLTSPSGPPVARVKFAIRPAGQH